MPPEFVGVAGVVAPSAGARASHPKICRMSSTSASMNNQISRFSASLNSMRSFVTLSQAAHTPNSRGLLTPDRCRMPGLVSEPLPIICLVQHSLRSALPLRFCGEHEL